MDLASSSPNMLQSLNNLHCTNFAHSSKTPSPACFLYSLGSDNGRIFPSGFLASTGLVLLPAGSNSHFLILVIACCFHKYAKVRKVTGTVPVKQSILHSITQLQVHVTWQILDTIEEEAASGEQYIKSISIITIFYYY